LAHHVVGADPAGGPHALDLLNVLALLAPLGASIPVLAAAFGPAVPRRAELVPLFVLALALAALAIVVNPLQGVVRDWDVYAPAGVAIAMIAAWLAGEALRGATRRTWIALAVALGAATHSVQSLLHLNAVRAGLSRIRPVLADAPPRSALEQARLWDALGTRHACLDDWNAAAAAIDRSPA